MQAKADARVLPGADKVLEPLLHAHGDLDLRVGAAEIDQRGHQDMLRRVAQGGDAQRSGGPVAAVTQVAQGRFQIVERGGHARDQALPRLRRAQAAGGAEQQRLAEARLKPGYGLADGGLGPAKGLRGAGEAALFRHRAQHQQVGKIAGVHSLS